MVTKHQSEKRVWDDDSDNYSDNEMLMKSETNWPRFFIVESASEDPPLQKLSSFAVQKGFQAIAGTLKSIKRLRDGSFLVECGKRAQARNLLQTNRFIDRPVKGSNQVSWPRWHVGGWDPGWTERSGCGWGEPSDTEEGGEGDPHQHSFLDVWFPELPKEITVGHLKVKTALLVPNPMRCFNCNKFDHTSHRCKVAAKCSECGKDKHEGRCKGPKLCQVTQAVL